MSKKYLVPIDMNGLEIQNFKAHNLAAAPTGSDGKIYFNTVDHKLYYYNGTSWVDLTASVTVDSAMSSSSTNPVQNKVINTALSGKVDTVSGKGLSTNDYTTADKNKLDSIGVGTSALITEGADTTNRVWQPKILHDYIASAIGGVDAMRFKGTIGTGGDITALPTSGVKVGDTYRVITAGTYAGQVCEVGDLIIATATTPTWTVAQTNIEGAITQISGTSPISVSGSGASRAVALEDSGVTAGSYVGTLSKGYYYIPTFTVDAKGRITSASQSASYISPVTASNNGLMGSNHYNSINTAMLDRIKYSSTSITAGQTSSTVIIDGYGDGANDIAGLKYMSSMIYVDSIYAFDTVTHEEVIVDAIISDPQLTDNTTYATTLTFSIAVPYGNLIRIRYCYHTLRM